MAETTMDGGKTSEKKDYPKLVTIAVMHMAQYFPEVFVSAALPAVFRANGLPLEYFALLSIPLWPRTFKFLFALVVDNYGSTKIGFRKSWIIPCTSIGAVIYVGLGFVEPIPTNVYAIVGILFAKTIIMTAQDISIDGFASEQFKEHERSTGAAMIVFLATAAGALGSVMLALIDSWGWTYAMWAAAALLIAAVAPGVIRKEPPPPAAVMERRAQGERASLINVVFRRENWFALPFLLFFGFQGTFHGAMGSVFLYDIGLTLTDIGLLAGAAAISGSAAAALTTPILIGKFGMRVTGIIGVFPLPVIGSFYVYLGYLGKLPEFFDLGIFGIYQGYWVLFAFSIASAFTGGIWVYAVNTSRFRWPSKRQAATDYATHSSVWNLGIALAALCSPLLAALFEGWLPVRFWAIFFATTYSVTVMVAITYTLVVARIDRICDERDELEEAGENTAVPTPQWMLTLKAKISRSSNQ